MYSYIELTLKYVSIKQHFGHHTGMVAAGASSFICPEQTTKR